ncbi:MAG: cation:proton antiporter [Chloroflexota bacterium]
MELLWIFVAFLAGMAAKLIRLPTMVGYLAAGVVLAYLGVQSTEFIKAVGDFGVVLLLFTVGLHLNFRSLVQPQVLGVGSIHLIISGLIFTAVLILLDLPVGTAVLVAVSLGFSSTVLTAKLLDVRDELDSYHGRLAIGVLILQDVVAVLLLIVAGGGSPTFWALGLLALPLARPLLLRLMQSAGRDELLLIFGLALALGAGWLFDLVGLDAKLGALLIGLVLAGDERSDELYDKLWALKEVFLVGFFLQVGLAGVPDGRNWLTVGLLLLFLPLKGVLFFGLMLRFRLRARTAFLSSVSLTAYSEFALIVVSSAAAAGLVETSFVVTTGLLVAISYALNAPVSQVVNTLWSRWEPWLTRYERAVEHPDREPRSLGAAEFVILGMGLAGSAAYDYLIQQEKRPLGIDADPAQIQRQLGNGRRVIYGDANDNELWTELDLSHVHGVLMTLGNANAEVRAAGNLRRAGFNGFIAAFLREVESHQALQEAGVTVSFLPIAQAGRELAQAALGQETAPASH